MSIFDSFSINASGLTAASAWGVERVTDKGYFADTSIRVTKTQKNSFAAVIQEVRSRNLYPFCLYICKGCRSGFKQCTGRSRTGSSFCRSVDGIWTGISDRKCRHRY